MDFLLPLIAVVALVWLTAFVLRGSLVAGCLVLLVGGSLFGYSFWNAGMLPLTIDRLLAVLLAVMYVVHRQLDWADRKPLTRADWVFLAFLGVLVVSTFTHDWHDQHSQPVFKLVQYFLIPAVAYWAVRQSPLNERNIRWIFGVLAVFGVYVSLTALAEMMGWHWALFPRHLASPKLEFFGRARGPLLNPAGNGVLITLCLAAGLTWWQRFRRPGQCTPHAPREERSPLNPQYITTNDECVTPTDDRYTRSVKSTLTGRAGQLALLAFTSLSTAAIYATLTRSAWIGGALGLAIFIALSAPSSWRNLLVGAGAVGVLLLVVAKWDQIWNLKRDADLAASASADSAELRPLLAKVAWNMFADHPLMGCGFGQYEREKLPYLADRTEPMPLEKTRPYVQHNAFLGLLTETGIIGASLFVLLLLLWTIAAFRLAIAADAPLWIRQVGVVFLTLLGAYLPNANFHDTNIMDMLNVWLFFMGGLVVGTWATWRRQLTTATPDFIAASTEDTPTSALAHSHS